MWYINKCEKIVQNLSQRDYSNVGWRKLFEENDANNILVHLSKEVTGGKRKSGGGQQVKSGGGSTTFGGSIVAGASISSGIGNAPNKKLKGTTAQSPLRKAPSPPPPTIPPLYHQTTHIHTYTQQQYHQPTGIAESGYGLSPLGTGGDLYRLDSLQDDYDSSLFNFDDAASLEVNSDAWKNAAAISAVSEGNSLSLNNNSTTVDFLTQAAREKEAQAEREKNFQFEQQRKQEEMRAKRDAELQLAKQRYEDDEQSLKNAERDELDKKKRLEAERERQRAARGAEQQSIHLDTESFIFNNI